MSATRSAIRARFSSQVLEQRRPPRTALGVGRARRLVGERRHRRHEPARALAKARPQRLVRDDREGAVQTGDVPGLARAHQRDRARRLVRAGDGGRHVTGALVEHEIGVYLVGDDNEIALGSERHDRAELVHREHRAGRVVRRAHHQEPRPLRAGRPHRLDIVGASPVDASERHLDQRLVPLVVGVEKVVVDRRVDERRLAAAEERPAARREPRHDARQPDEPPGFDVPAVLRREVPPHRVDECVRGDGVAVDRVGETRPRARGRIGGATAKSMSATQNGSTSRSR